MIEFPIELQKDFHENLKKSNNLSLLGSAVINLICVDTLYEQLGHKPFSFIQQSMERVCTREYLAKIGVKLLLNCEVSTLGISSYQPQEINYLKAFKIAVAIYYINYKYEKTKVWLSPIFKIESSNSTLKLNTPFISNKSIDGVETLLNYKFNNEKLLCYALGGSTYNPTFQYLCLIGDRVITLNVIENIYKLNISKDNLQSIKNTIVSNKTFSEIFCNYGLKRWITNQETISYSKCQSDFLEAIFGAVYLDSFYEETKIPFNKLINRHLKQLTKKHYERRFVYDNKRK